MPCFSLCSGRGSPNVTYLYLFEVEFYSQYYSPIPFLSSFFGPVRPALHSFLTPT